VAGRFVIWVSFKVRSVGVVKVFNALLAGELTQDINVAVGAFVGSEDVMIWDQDDLGSQTLASVPALEHTDSAGTTDIMSHQQVNIKYSPRLYHRPTGGSGHFGEGHAIAIAFLLVQQAIKSNRHSACHSKKMLTVRRSVNHVFMSCLKLTRRRSKLSV